MHQTPPFVPKLPTLQGSSRQAHGTSGALTNITTVQIAKWGSIRSDRLGGKGTCLIQSPRSSYQMLRFRLLLQFKRPVYYFCQEEAAWTFAPIFSPGSVLHCVLRGPNYHVQFNLSITRPFTKPGHRAWPRHRRTVPPGTRNRSRHRAILSMVLHETQ